jgi:hypothetical protein
VCLRDRYSVIPASRNIIKYEWNKPKTKVFLFFGTNGLGPLACLNLELTSETINASMTFGRTPMTGNSVSQLNTKHGGIQINNPSQTGQSFGLRNHYDEQSNSCGNKYS